MHTNIVYNNKVVAYKERLIFEAINSGGNLLCYSEDRPGEVMTIPNFLIHKLVKWSDRMYYDAEIGMERPLGYFIWRSDKPDPNQKTLF